MIINPYVFAAQGETAFRYFRLTADRWYANNVGPGRPGFVRISEMEIYTASNTKYPTSVMTGNTSPSPLVASSRSTLSGGFDPWHAFDGSTSDSARYISSDETGVQEWLQIDLGDGTAITPAYFKIAPDAAVTSPSFNFLIDFWIDGSNTGDFSGEQTRILTRTNLSTGDWTPSSFSTFTV